jgi:restriction system protein
MPLPSIFELTLPLLRLAANDEISYARGAAVLGEQFGLSGEEMEELVPSGGQTRWENRLRWAKVELGQAKLVETTRPKHFRATDAGRAILAQSPARLDYRFMMTIPVYRDVVERARQKARNRLAVPAAVAASVTIEPQDHDIAPAERIEASLKEIEEALGQELIERLSLASPAFFERAILEVIVAMGYGSSVEEAARHVGGPGDGGIDGVVDGDPLGLDRIYLQAKRYKPGGHAVGAEEVRGFLGALVARGAGKGVLITTSSFTQAATDFVRALQHRIVLVDGSTLAGLMIRYGVGVRLERKVEIKKIDDEFFGGSGE